VNVKHLRDTDLPAALYLGLKRRKRDLDLVRVQHIGLTNADDPVILSVAAELERIVVSRDKSTMRGFAADRIKAGQKMPGLLLVRPGFSTRHGGGLGLLIDELLLIAACSDAEEWDNMIQFIPFLFD
jgi:predicted nuclease of predicted toxin-antitoxin system